MTSNVNARGGTKCGAPCCRCDGHVAVDVQCVFLCVVLLVHPILGALGTGKKRLRAYQHCIISITLEARKTNMALQSAGM